MKRARTKALPRKKKVVEQLDTARDPKQTWDKPELEVGLMFESPESSTIERALYNPSTEELVVFFRRSAGPDRYDYAGVPVHRWVEFAAAESKGAYFATQIRPHFIGRWHGERT